MKGTNDYTFLIADDHSVVRQGISLIVKELYTNAKILTASNFKEIFTILKDTKVDLMVLDINFPEGNSIGIVADILHMQPNVKVLVFTAYDENFYALRYLDAGASGFLNKGCEEEEIKRAITSIFTSGKYVTKNIKEKILDTYMSKKPINPLEKLSAREVEVAKLLIKGYGNLEISELLQIKKTTVSTFKIRIFDKLEIANLPSLIELFNFYYEEKNK